MNPLPVIKTPAPHPMIVEGKIVKRVKEGYPLYTLSQLMQLEDSPDRWILRDMIPRAGRTVAYGIGGDYKCRCSGQRVSLADGTHPPIESLYGTKQLALCYDQAGGKTVRAEIHVTSNGKVPVVHVRTWSGRIHSLTPNEPMLTQRGWVIAGQILPTDFLRSPRRFPEPENCIGMDLGLAYLWGYLIGDGNLSCRCVLASCYDSGVLAKIREVAADLQLGIKQVEEGKEDYRINGGIASMLRSHGLMKTTSHTKRIPPFVFRWSNKAISAFCGGYWDANGSYAARNTCLSYTSVSKSLLLDQQLLLLRLGLPSTIGRYSGEYREERRSFYRLSIYGGDSAAFFEYCPTHSEKGSTAKKELAGRADTPYEIKSERVPAQLLQTILSMMGAKFAKKYLGYSSDGREYSTARRSTLERAADSLHWLGSNKEWRERSRSHAVEISDEQFFAWSSALKDLCNPDFYWDKVHDVKDGGTNLTWAISCPEYETVVCEGSVTHNTTLLLDMALSIASAGQMLESIPLQCYGPVIVLSTEGDIYANRDRFLYYIKSRNLHPDNVQIAFGQRRLRLDLAEGFSVLEQMVQAIRPIFILLDPYVSFFSGDENSTRDASMFVEHLDDLIQRYRVSVCLIHHSNKVGAMRGSTVIQGWADSILKFEVKRGVHLPGVPRKVDILSVKGEKQRNGRMGQLFSAVPVIDSDAQMTRLAYYMDKNTTEVVVTFLRMEVYKYLRKCPQGTGLLKKDLCKLFSVGNDKMTMALDQLEAVKLISQDAPLNRNGRAYLGYRAAPGGAKVDAVKAMLKLSEDNAQLLVPIDE